MLDELLGLHAEAKALAVSASPQTVHYEPGNAVEQTDLVIGTLLVLAKVLNRAEHLIPKLGVTPVVE
jgi:hypothetical protein